MRAVCRSTRWALVVGTVALVLWVPIGGAGAAEDRPQIGFASGESRGSSEPDPVDLYVTDADGSGLVNLTTGYGADWAWAWSPDGSRIAFISHQGAMDRIYVRALDTLDAIAVTDGPAPDEWMVWSPDGTRIAFTSTQDGNSEIYVVDVTTRSTRNVSNDPWESSHPKWSPTGSHLSYDVRVADGTGNYTNVYVVGTPGGSPVNVTNDSAWSPWGAWSPDGSRFLFVSNRNGDDDIYMADGDGRNAVRLTGSPANDRDPAWSPDGTQIAFSSGLETESAKAEWQVVIPSRIYLMGADGSNRRAITDGSIDPDPNPNLSFSIAHADPTWSPDGSRLAMVVAMNATIAGPHGRTFTVYVVDPTHGGAPVNLWSKSGVGSLRWGPDGTKVAIQSLDSRGGIGSANVIAAADGSETPVELTQGAATGFGGWSTYGTHVAYSNSGMSARSDVFVAGPDGVNPLSITASLDGPHHGAASWRPQPMGQVGLVDPSSGLWHLRDEWGWIDSFYYGNPGDYPFVGDWDCDGADTPGLYRQSDGYVYLRNSITQGVADIKFFFGNPGDIPLAGDFNGDGCDTVSIYRPSEQRFYIINDLGENDGGLGAADYDFVFGNPGDQPVVGDWDGDGINEIGLHRASTGFFYYRNTLTTGVADDEFYFGDPDDRFVAGDWGTIDGKDTPAVFRPSNTVFYFRHSLGAGNADSQFTWPAGGAGWLPVAGNFDGEE